MLSSDSQNTIPLRTCIVSIWASSRNKSTICNRLHRQTDHFSCMWTTLRVCHHHRHHRHHILFVQHNHCHWTLRQRRIDKVLEWGYDVLHQFSLHDKCRKYSNFLAKHESRPNHGIGIAAVCTQNRLARASNRRWPQRMHDHGRIRFSLRHLCDRRDSTCDISGNRMDRETRHRTCMGSFLHNQLDCMAQSHSSILLLLHCKIRRHFRCTIQLVSFAIRHWCERSERVNDNLGKSNRISGVRCIRALHALKMTEYVAPFLVTTILQRTLSMRSK